MKPNLLREEKKKPSAGQWKPVPLVIGLGVVLLLIVGVAWAVRSSQAQKKARVFQALVDKVGTHLTIKREEKPLIATVKDEKLVREKNPAFYRDAVNGDRVLLWSDQVVLFRESEDRVLAVLPVSIPSATTSDAGAASTVTALSKPAQETSVLEVRNGSGIGGAGKSAVDRLKAIGFDVLPATDAKAKTIYAKTVIMKGNDKPLPLTAAMLQQITGAAMVTSSKAEAPIKGDYLIILGEDFKK
ncbi:MAG: LytR C-terminal domain-containing protein [bacterium]|nr:LytR C-terminal domain-containing protein [bacterium]